MTHLDMFISSIKYGSDKYSRRTSDVFFNFFQKKVSDLGQITAEMEIFFWKKLKKAFEVPLLYLSLPYFVSKPLLRLWGKY